MNQVGYLTRDESLGHSAFKIADKLQMGATGPSADLPALMPTDTRHPGHARLPPGGASTLELFMLRAPVFH